VNILVCYDVDTSDKSGTRRLRRVARVCLGFGQRVQDSVFECTFRRPAEYEKLRAKLTKEIDLEKDSLRFYHLPEDRSRAIKVVGIDRAIDLEGLLLIQGKPGADPIE
jgi:CRISPR-associated protein Cas2